MGRETASKKEFQSVSRKQNLHRFIKTEEATVRKLDSAWGVIVLLTRTWRCKIQRKMMRTHRAKVEFIDGKKNCIQITSPSSFLTHLSPPGERWMVYSLKNLVVLQVYRHQRYFAKIRKQSMNEKSSSWTTQLPICFSESHYEILVEMTFYETFEKNFPYKRKIMVRK